jgi:hypothetical protein
VEGTTRRSGDARQPSDSQSARQGVIVSRSVASYSRAARRPHRASWRTRPSSISAAQFGPRVRSPRRRPTRRLGSTHSMTWRRSRRARPRSGSTARDPAQGLSTAHTSAVGRCSNDGDDPREHTVGCFVTMSSIRSWLMTQIMLPAFSLSLPCRPTRRARPRPRQR